MDLEEKIDEVLVPMKSKEAGKKFVCKHITIRPDQNERIKNWPHGELSKLTQDPLDLILNDQFKERVLYESKKYEEFDNVILNHILKSGNARAKGK